MDDGVIEAMASRTCPVRTDTDVQALYLADGNQKAY